MRPTLALDPTWCFVWQWSPLPELKVFVVGPRLASQCDFELEVEVWDPVRPTAPKEDFQFSWRCSSLVQQGEPDACSSLPQFRADSQLQVRGPKLRISSGQLPAGMHRFSVIVRRTSGGPESVARKAVQVNSTFFAPLSLLFPAIRLQRYHPDCRRCAQCLGFREHELDAVFAHSICSLAMVSG